MSEPAVSSVLIMPVPAAVMVAETFAGKIYDAGAEILGSYKVDRTLLL
jgi:hypothetical protein